MPRTPPRTAALAGLLATLALTAPAAAEAPGYDPGAASRSGPRRLAHRPLPPSPAGGHDVRGPASYGAPSSYGPVVRAYLPRHHSVPMYNEPPAR